MLTSSCIPDNNNNSNNSNTTTTTSPTSNKPKTRKKKESKKTNDDQNVLVEYDRLDSSPLIPETAGDGKTTGRQDDEKQQNQHSICDNQSPVTIVCSWLRDNFEECKESSISREAIYQDYTNYGRSNTLDIINSASFGKIIRTVFPLIRNRRLGIRGHSKYHYHGINIKQNSSLMSNDSYSLESMREAVKAEVVVTRRKSKTALGGGSGKSSGLNDDNYQEDYEDYTTAESMTCGSLSRDDSRYSMVLDDQPCGSATSGFSCNNHASQRITIPSYPGLPLILETGIAISHVEDLIETLTSHYDQLRDALQSNNLVEAEKQVVEFWKGVAENQQILQLLPNASITKLIVDYDIFFYSGILNYVFAVLCGDGNSNHGSSALSSEEIQNTTATMKLFGDSIEKWLFFAVDSLPEYLKLTKLQTAHTFCVSMKRAIGLYDFEKTFVDEVLMKDRSVRNSMASELLHVDMLWLNGRVSSTCQWQQEFLPSVGREIVTHLKGKPAIESWKDWLNQFALSVSGFPTSNATHQYQQDGSGCDLIVLDFNCKQFITKFSFYLSQLMREMCLKRVKHLDMWHKMRFFIEEYTWFVVNKQLTMHKIQNISRFPGQKYPNWINSMLFFQLEQRNFFGGPMPISYYSASGNATPSLYALSRIPSSHELLSVLSRGNSIDAINTQNNETIGGVLKQSASSCSIIATAPTITATTAGQNL